MRRIIEDDHGIEWTIEWKGRMILRSGPSAGDPPDIETPGLLFNSTLGTLIIPRQEPLDLRSVSFRDLADLIEERWYRPGRPGGGAVDDG